jgi:hypothetical protein
LIAAIKKVLGDHSSFVIDGELLAFNKEKKKYMKFSTAEYDDNANLFVHLIITEHSEGDKSFRFIRTERG